VDEKLFGDRVRRLREVSKVVESLDPAIRAEAFLLLRDYVIGHPDKPGRASKSGNESEPPGELNIEALLEAHTHEKPADNLHLLAACHFAEYGANPFSLEGIRDTASSFGLTIPERSDMTFVQAKRDGKNIYKRAGQGMFKPTVTGEAFLKKTYNVTKGNKKLPGGLNDPD